jgi:DNA helicase-2/ATP-dependent DNA helicase PcrA
MRECLKETASEPDSDISPDSLFQQLSQMKSDCSEKELTLATLPALTMSGLDVPVRETIHAYHTHLAERNALDFPDLLYRTRSMLALLPEKRTKWAARFQWIQMDEVQDTHVSEYESSACSPPTPPASPSSAISTRPSTNGAAPTPTKS